MKVGDLVQLLTLRGEPVDQFYGVVLGFRAGRVRVYWQNSDVAQTGNGAWPWGCLKVIHESR
jgi:hypothetical protein